MAIQIQGRQDMALWVKAVHQSELSADREHRLIVPAAAFN
jgi:hypothetical protein